MMVTRHHYCYDSIITVICMILGNIVPFVRSDSTPARKVKDGNIYGIITSSTVPVVPSEIVDQCFYGFGIENCEIENIEQLELDGFNYTQTLQSAENPNYFYPGYCLMWPFSVSYSSSPFVIWDINCDKLTDSDASRINRFGGQVRFSAHKWDGDVNVISCPMKRSACSYTSNDELMGCASDNKNFIHSYNLTVNVKRKTDGNDFWRSVDSCSVVVGEAVGKPKSFKAQIVIVDVSSNPYIWNRSGVLYLTGALVIIMLILCRQCRRQKCLVCTKPLIIFHKKCLLCRLMSNPLPPPALLHMIGDLRESDERQKDWFKGPDDKWLFEMKMKEKRTAAESLRANMNYYTPRIAPTFQEGAKTFREVVSPGVTVQPPPLLTFRSKSRSPNSQSQKSKLQSKMHPVNEERSFTTQNPGPNQGGTKLSKKGSEIMFLSPLRTSSTTHLLSKGTEDKLKGLQSEKSRQIKSIQQNSKKNRPMLQSSSSKTFGRRTQRNGPALSPSVGAPFSGNFIAGQTEASIATLSTADLSSSMTENKQPNTFPSPKYRSPQRTFHLKHEMKKTHSTEIASNKHPIGTNSRKNLNSNIFLNRNRSITMTQFQQQFRGKYIPNLTPPEGMNPFTPETPRKDKLKRTVSGKVTSLNTPHLIVPWGKAQSAKLRLSPKFRKGKRPKSTGSLAVTNKNDGFRVTFNKKGPSQINHTQVAKSSGMIHHKVDSKPSPNISSGKGSLQLIHV